MHFGSLLSVVQSLDDRHERRLHLRQRKGEKARGKDQVMENIEKLISV